MSRAHFSIQDFVKNIGGVWLGLTPPPDRGTIWATMKGKMRNMGFGIGDLQDMFQTVVDKLSDEMKVQKELNYRTAYTTKKGLRLRVILSEVQATIELYEPSQYIIVFRTGYAKDTHKYSGDVGMGKEYIDQILVLEKLGIL